MIIYRFDQSKVYIETLIEAFPCSIELWIELLLIPEISENITEVNFLEKIFNRFIFNLFYRLLNVLEKQQEFIMNLFIHWYYLNKFK